MQLYSRTFLLPLCVLLISSSCFAIDPGVVQPKRRFSLAKLSAVYKNAESVEADFVQEVYQASLARTKTSNGNLRIQKPANVRWEIYKPEASILVSNGHRLSYYTPSAGTKGKGQVIERDAAELKSKTLFQILMGNSALEKEFDIKTVERVENIKAGHDTKLTLIPKHKLGELTELRLVVNAKYMISEIYLQNESGNTTKISLLNQQLNAKFPPVLFSFVAPPGTEIIKNNE